MSNAKDLLLIIVFLSSFFVLIIIENFLFFWIINTLVFLTVIIKYQTLKQEFLEERNYFIQTLSHDLRVSTIAQIRGLELLQKNPDKEIIEEVTNSCKYTFDMITMLLNTYRFKSNDEFLQKEVFNLTEIIEPLSKKLDFINLSDKTLWINADKPFLRKALDILVTTAINHSFGNNKVVLKTNEQDENIYIAITYKGKSLSDEEQRRMFDRNPQYSTVGYGIKMNLCKKIIEFHGGKISVNSDMENYNIFKITLPQKIYSKQTHYLFSSKIPIST